jgi:putative ABC transport system permease protein
MNPSSDTFVTDVLAASIGLVAGTALLVVLFGLVLFLPVVIARALRVWFRREGVPLLYNLRSLRQRKLTTLATLLILALVVFVLTTVSMLALGIQHTLASTGNPSNVKLVHENALSEWVSWIDMDQFEPLEVLPGMAKDDTGKPLLSPEMVVLIWAPRQGAKDADDGANLIVRGLLPVGFQVHPIRALHGERFKPGTNQILIGKALVGRFVGAHLGGTMTFAERDWTVVGVMDHDGSAHDSEIWGDIEVTIPTFKRGPASATVRLSDPSQFDEFSAALHGDPRLSGTVAKREVAYWRALSENYVGFVRLLGGIVTLIFSFGAILGALNTMYAQVAARSREIGTLRAIGFKPRAILTSVLTESVLLALLAGMIGVLGASLLSRTTFQLTTDQTLSEISYSFHLSPELALGCLGFAAWMGYAGGLLPALRASRMPIVDAVRAN